MSIRNGRAGDLVWIEAFGEGKAHGIIVRKGKPRYNREYVWYLVEVLEPGESRFRKGDRVELRPGCLTRRVTDG
jgi:hypothetical protein